MAQYAKITQILQSPSVPVVGQPLFIDVYLKNIGGTARKMWPGVTRYDGITFRVYDELSRMHVLLQPKEIHAWGGQFVMPNKSVTVYVESWAEGDDGIWRSDDSMSKVVELAPSVGGWISLATSSLSVKKAITGGWVSLATISLTVGVGIVSGQDIFKSLAVDFEKSLPKEFA